MDGGGMGIEAPRGWLGERVKMKSFHPTLFMRLTINGFPVSWKKIISNDFDLHTKSSQHTQNASQSFSSLSLFMLMARRIRDREEGKEASIKNTRVAYVWLTNEPWLEHTANSYLASAKALVSLNVAEANKKSSFMLDLPWIATIFLCVTPRNETGRG